MATEPFKIYEDGDPTEDFYMLDKALAKEAGVADLMEAMAFGQGRYGERIFDQKSNLFQKDVMGKRIPVAEKKRLLGDHIYKELRTHMDFGGRSNVATRNFLTGGEVENWNTIISNLEKNLEESSKRQSSEYNRLMDSFSRGEAAAKKRRDEIAADNAAKREAKTEIAKLGLVKAELKKASDRLEADKKAYKSAVDKLKEDISKRGNYSSSQLDSRLLTTAQNLQKVKISLDQQADLVSRIRPENFNISGQPGGRSLTPVDGSGISKTGNGVLVLSSSIPSQEESVLSSQQVPALSTPGLFPSANAAPSVASTPEQISAALLSTSVPTPQSTNRPSGSVEEYRSAMDSYDAQRSSGNIDSRGTSIVAPAGTSQNIGSRVFITPEGGVRNLVTAKEIYNEWARNTGRPQLAETGEFNSEVNAAFEQYNRSRPARPININTSAIHGYGEATTTAEIVNGVELGEFSPAELIGPATRLGAGASSTRRIGGQAAEIASLAAPISITQPTVPGVTPVVQPQSEQRGLSSQERQNLFNALGNAAAGVTGAMMASTDIPTWEPPQEYYTMRDEIYGRRDQGLSAEEWASISQSLDRSYANGVAQVRVIGGGGVGQASALAALGQLSSARDRGALQATLADVNARRANQQAYHQAVLTDVDMDRLVSQPYIDSAMQTRQAGAQMVAQAAQNLYDQQRINQDYGPNSLYAQYMRMQEEDRKRWQESQRGTAEAFRRSLTR